MDQQPFNPCAPQGDSVPVPDSYQGQQPYPQQPFAQPQQPYGPLPTAVAAPYMPPMAQAPQAPQEQKLSGMAIAGMVIGILCLVGSPIPIVNNFVFFVAIVGLVLSVIGFLGIRKNPVQKGKGMAIAGVVLGVVAVIVVFASQAFYGAVLDEVSNQIDESASSYSSGSYSTYTAPSKEFSASDSGLATTGATDDAAPTQEDAANGQDMALGSVATFADGTAVTVVSVTPGLTNFDGSAVACATVQYTNEGSKNVIFNPYDWKAQDPQGAQRTQTYYSDEESSLHACELTSGGTVTGNVYFDEPVSKIIYSPSLFTSDGDVSWLVS